MAWGKKKEKDEEVIDEVVAQPEDNSVEGEDAVILDEFKEEKAEKEEKQAKEEAKAKAKEERKAYRKEHGVKATFNMYKFIIKILVFAMLLAFGIILLVNKDNLIGAVYMVGGIVILASALIRFIPLLKTVNNPKSRIVMFVQIGIHAVIGIYLIFAAFYHWDKLNEFTNSNNIIKTGKETVYEKLEKVSGGSFARFNIDAFAYILVIYFYTFALGYYWTTILYKENTRRTMFWLNTVAFTLAVLLGIFADKLNAEQLIIALAVLAILSSLVIGGEAGGGYIMYRRKIAADNKKDEVKEAPQVEAPATETNKDKEIIDPVVNDTDTPDQPMVN